MSMERDEMTREVTDSRTDTDEDEEREKRERRKENEREGEKGLESGRGRDKRSGGGRGKEQGVVKDGLSSSSLGLVAPTRVSITPMTVPFPRLALNSHVAPLDCYWRITSTCQTRTETQPHTTPTPGVCKHIFSSI